MKNLFIQISMMSFCSSFIVLFLLPLRVIFRNVQKKYVYFLWAIPFIRLIIPVFIQSKYSILTLLGLLGSNSSLENRTVNEIPVDVSANKVFTLVDVASYIWLFVFIALFLITCYRYIRLSMKLRHATFVEKNIYELDGIEMPFTFGIIKRRIYVPKNLSNNYKNAVVLHESVHIKRFDSLIKIVTILITEMHWFNPLIWLSYRIMCNDMEMSCDEAVIKKIDCKEYAFAILNFATHDCKRHVVLSFASLSTKTRIKNVLKKKKTNNVISVLMVFICVFMCLIGLTNPMAKNLVVKAKKSDDSIKISDNNIQRESTPELDTYPYHIEYEIDGAAGYYIFNTFENDVKNMPEFDDNNEGVVLNFVMQE